MLINFQNTEILHRELFIYFPCCYFLFIPNEYSAHLQWSVSPTHLYIVWGLVIILGNQVSHSFSCLLHFSVCFLAVCLSRRLWAMCLWYQHQLDHHVVHPSCHRRRHLDYHGPMPELLPPTGEILKQNWGTFIGNWSLKVMAKAQENSSKKFCF